MTFTPTLSSPPFAAASGPVAGSVWRTWELCNVAHHAVSLCGELLEAAALRRLSEVNRALHVQVLPRLVGEKRRNGSTRLHLTVGKDRVWRAHALLAAGADPLALNDDEEAPLERAVYLWRDAVGPLLVRNEAVYSLSALRMLAEKRRLLHLAVECRKDEMVAALLEPGVGVDTEDEQEQTDLHVAADRGAISLIKLLLSAGANMDAEDRRGSSPLQLAASAGEVDAVRLLLDAGASIENRDSSGQTALYHACKDGRVQVAQLLVERGADPRALDVAGWSPLDAARMFRQVFLLPWLEGLLGV